METLEVETADGWVPILAAVRALGERRFRAEVRLPSVVALDTARLRLSGKPVRHAIVETKASSRPRVAIVVLELEVLGA